MLTSNRFDIKKGQTFCPVCFKKAERLALSSEEDLALNVVFYKSERKMLKLLDRDNWDEIKRPTINFCLDCGEKRRVALIDINLYYYGQEEF
jgi:hypothetical protein